MSVGVQKVKESNFNPIFISHPYMTSLKAPRGRELETEEQISVRQGKCRQRTRLWAASWNLIAYLIMPTSK
jgi:hypothetical protein